MKSLDLIVGITCTLILLVVWSAYLLKKNNMNTIFGKHAKFLGFALSVLTLVQIGIWVYYFIKTKNNHKYDASHAIVIGSLFTVLPLMLYFGYNLLNDMDNNSVNIKQETQINGTIMPGETARESTLNSTLDVGNIDSSSNSTLDGTVDSSTGEAMPTDLEATQ